MVQSASLGPPPYPTVTSPFPVAEESPGQTGSSPRLHMCVLWRLAEKSKGYDSLCLIFNIISSISMSQTAPAKQSLMIQTHTTHTGWEWEGFKTEKTNAAFSFVLYTVFPGQRLLERHLGYICLILQLACLQGVVFQSAKLYFSISASRGHWVMGFLALLSY